MERCRLCYGQVVGGRCVSCGLDNSKSDKQYRLNVHNEKTARLHGGSCEENLNTKQTRNTSYAQAISNAQRASNTQKASNVQRASNAQKSRTQTSAARYDKAGSTARRITPAERKKQLKQRQATGTVQKRRGKKWMILLILLIWYLLQAFLQYADTHQYSVSETAVIRIEELLQNDLSW